MKDKTCRGDVDCDIADKSFVERLIADAACVLPPGVAICYRRIGDCIGHLYPVEERSIRNVVPRRRQEYLAGRVCARAALARFGIEPQPIPTGSNREPVWPEHITGSISHDGDYCVVAAALKQTVPLLGLDLARQQAFDGLAAQVCTRQDHIDVEDIRAQMPGIDPAMLIFSIKEALYKCLFPRLRRFIDFKEVAVVVDAHTRSARVLLLNPELHFVGHDDLHATYFHAGNYLLTIVWLVADAPFVASAENTWA